MLEAVAAVERRQLLLELREDNPHGELPELCERESDPSTEVLAFRMQHVHLPKLAGQGFVDWNREAGSVMCGPNYELLLPVLDMVDDGLPGPS